MFSTSNLGSFFKRNFVCLSFFLWLAKEKKRLVKTNGYVGTKENGVRPGRGKFFVQYGRFFFSQVGHVYLAKNAICNLSHCSFPEQQLYSFDAKPLRFIYYQHARYLIQLAWTTLHYVCYRNSGLKGAGVAAQSSSLFLCMKHA